MMNKYLRQAIEEHPNDGYLLYHAPRYDKLLELLNQYYVESAAILEAGGYSFSKIVSRAFNTQIDTLGFEDDKQTATGYNYHFDLNDAQVPGKWRRGMPKYDIILFCEVIEHLHTSPLLVLQFLKSILKEGGLIIIQTPNAVSLHKRIKMVFGKNPYQLIAENVGDPNHFREYTMDELTDYCLQVGYKIEEKSVNNYFDYGYRNHIYNSSEVTNRYRLINLFYKLLPSSMRPGLCFVIRSGGS
jgi:SAM-dependent methyltransferase